VGFDYEKVKNWPIPPVKGSYTRQDVIDFARAIGCGLPGPLCKDEQKFIRDEPGLQALPMMSLILNEGTMWTQDPNAHIDWTQTVHAEESLVMFRPLATEGELIAEHRVEEIYDKGPGKGALMYERRLLRAPDGSPVAEMKVATFLRANGGLGGCTERSPLPHPLPIDRPADASVQVATPAPKNAVYQLGNEFIAALKIPPLPDGQVILRGVCAFAVAARGLIKLCCGMDPSRLLKMSLRYAGAMYSGETILIEVWKQGTGRAGFQVTAIERKLVILKNGFIEYRD
jgi:hypothetical protein